MSTIYDFKNREVKIEFNSIQFGNSAYINQPIEVIDYIKYQQQEIERLNNIINELEKAIIEFKKQIEEERKNYLEIIGNFVDKVRELKGSE